MQLCVQTFGHCGLGLSFWPSVHKLTTVLGSSPCSSAARCWRHGRDTLEHLTCSLDPAQQNDSALDPNPCTLNLQSLNPRSIKFPALNHPQMPKTNQRMFRSHAANLGRSERLSYLQELPGTPFLSICTEMRQDTSCVEARLGFEMS